MKLLFKQSLFANLTTIFIILMGITAFFQLPREVFPDVDFDIVQVTTTYRGASPEQVERLITNPIEDEVKTVFGIRDIYSSSVEGISSITIEIDPDYPDKDEVVTEVQRAVDRTEDLPLDADRPIVTELKTARSPSILVGLRLAGELTPEYEPSIDLRTAAKRLKRELELVEGVAEVSLDGEEDLEFLVEFDTKKLRRAGITVDEVEQAFRTQNQSVPAGEFESPEGTIRFRIENELGDQDRVENVVLRATVDGQVFKVKDVARVELRQREADVYYRVNGRPSIVLNVVKTEGSDVIDVVDAMKERNEVFLSQLRDQTGQQWETTYAADRTLPVRVRLEALGTSILIGGVLVFLLLLLALNWKTALIVAIGIPFSILGAIIILPAFGFSLNLLTMFGFVVVLGMLVDDAIVVAESIFTDLEDGKSAEDATYDGTVRVVTPVIGSVMTSVVAFTPMVFMTGIFGKFVKFIPAVVIICLLVSLLEAFFLLPNHMRDYSKAPKMGSRDSHWFERIRDAYRKIIRFSIRRRYLVATGGMAFVVLAVFLQISFGRFVLFPREGVETFFIEVEGDPKLSVNQMAERMLLLEKELATYPKEDVYAFATTLGSKGQEDQRRTGSNYAQVGVYMTPELSRETSVKEVMDRVRPAVEKLPDIIDFSIEEEGGGPPVGKAVNLLLQSDDLEMLRKVTLEAREFLEELEGVHSIGDSDLPGKAEAIYEIDFERALTVGVSPQSLGTGLRMAVEGAIVGTVREGVEKKEIRIQAHEEEDPMVSMKNLTVLTQTGELIPIERLLKKTNPDPGPVSIQHFNAQRNITVYASVYEDQTSAVVVNDLLAEKFPEWREKYPGLSIEVLGENRDTQESLISLRNAGLIAIAGIIFVMIITLGSAINPFIVLATSIPLGLAGVIYVFLLHNRPLTFLALFGIVGLMGVAVNVGIVLIDRIDSLSKELSFKEALIEGSAQRLRAVLLTSATTVLGLMPTAYGIGGGDPFLKSMALALGWGIAFSTILGILIIPVTMAIVFDMKYLFFKVFLKREIEVDKPPLRIVDKSTDQSRS